MKEKAQLIKAKREAERLQVVEQKRLQQYRNQNELLRPALVKLHNIESKMINLQQMRENEAKRESEREIDRFYHGVMMKEISEKMKREEQDAIKYGDDMRKTVETWNQQIRGKELLKEEYQAIQEEDREEIQKNIQQLKDELNEERMTSIKEKEARRKDLQEQIEQRARFLSQRQKELDALDRAFAHLNNLELAKEQTSNYEARIQARKEMMTYNKYVADLKRERMEEEEQMNAILQAHQNEILRKQDEITCKTKHARLKMISEVNQIRAKQIEDIKAKKIREKQKEEEINEFMKKAIEMDVCLDKEAERLRKEEIAKYREDLCKQIEYNKLIKERYEQEIAREQKMSDEEEAKYLAILDRMVQDKFEGGSKHPFRAVLEEFECYCRENETKNK
ncbi:hypothetical protein WA026_017500 [Henosepilachna vigintioctopunctata]|uniref:Cilia- and flagella-associated protein 53 n=1 Tax=Henosepilachna vigintioctopunctata TaxID=420089 RepID=A0AAW1USR0_9CUCU